MNIVMLAKYLIFVTAQQDLTGKVLRYYKEVKEISKISPELKDNVGKGVYNLTGRDLGKIIRVTKHTSHWTECKQRDLASKTS